MAIVYVEDLYDEIFRTEVEVQNLVLYLYVYGQWLITKCSLNSTLQVIRLEMFLILKSS